jgi:ribulose-phosphate 3-epimerase
MTVYPSILTESMAEAQRRLELLDTVGGEHTVHIDVIDGLFADNVTITPADLPHLWFPEGWKCDLHLMTDEPMDYVFELVEVKEELPIRSVIGQLERMSSQSEFLTEVKKHGWRVGLAVDLYTPTDEIDPGLIEQLDVVLLMGVPAGFSGQTLRPHIWEKIEEFRKQANPPELEFLLDGGVTLAGLEDASAKGFTAAVMDSALWQGPNPVDTLLTLYANER